MPRRTSGKRSRRSTLRHANRSILLRSLVNLLLEQHNLREGPPLEDLIATLIVQQREIQTIARQTRADVRALLQGSRESPTRNGYTARPNGSASC